MPHKAIHYWAQAWYNVDPYFHWGRTACGKNTCYMSDDPKVTLLKKDVTCGRCRRTRAFKRAKSKGTARQTPDPKAIAEARRIREKREKEKIPWRL